MVLTTTTKIAIKHLLENLYHGRESFDNKIVDYAFERVCEDLENKTVAIIKVDGSEFVGQVSIVALLAYYKTEFVERNGKKYVKHPDENIHILAAENYATMVKETTMVYKPRGWGNGVTDSIIENPTYTMATCNDLDCINDANFVYC